MIRLGVYKCVWWDMWIGCGQASYVPVYHPISGVRISDSYRWAVITLNLMLWVCLRCLSPGYIKLESMFRMPRSRDASELVGGFE